ncbi:dihydrolipoamide acetyltransferase family protein [Planctomycetota bacterium]
MAKEVRLPQLGQTMEEGTIVECMVKVGDEVKKGDVIFEVETDKATLEVESTAEGFVKHVLAEVDQTLPVGDALLVLGAKDEQVPQAFIDSLKSEALAGGQVQPAAPAEPAAEPTTQPQPQQAPARVIASPRAKKLAQQLSVDLATVTGTGPGDKITEDDVKKASSAKPAAKAVTEQEVKLGATIKINKLQKITAERMVKSKNEIPCYYLTVKADVTDLVAQRTKMNEEGSVKIAYNDFLIKAVAAGLEKFSIMTGQLEGDVIKLPNTINVGLAVAAPKGLIVPVVKDAQKKNLKQIAEDTNSLIEKARNEKLQLTDLEGACITVSNLGVFGVDFFIPIVIPGQCSILGVGQITDTCVPNNNGIAVRKLMNLTLSVDHKVANGAYAAQFLDYVRKLLEDPSTLV